MKRTKILVALVASVALTAQSTKKEQDIKAIKDMCGCHEVTFNYAETFKYSDDPQYKPSKEMHSKAIEYVYLLEDSDNKISLQHLLIVGNPASPGIVKHWRQDWIYENTNLHLYKGNREWEYKKMSKPEVKGQWTQKVYHVDDGPRYEGTATWVHVDGKHYWENHTEAPTPRREYTKRNDYNLISRDNRHEIIKGGWVHEQDNKKVLLKDGKSTVIAEEKGYNTYMKVDDSKCKSAKDWWKKHEGKWAIVRKKWDKEFAKNKDLKLHHKLDGKKLYQELFKLDPKVKPAKINKAIDKFIK